ncbi:hypothetical protein ACYU03_07455 [Pseudomonas sp. X10]
MITGNNHENPRHFKMIKLWHTLFREEKYSNIVDDAKNHPLESLSKADFNYLGLAALASESSQWFDEMNSASIPAALQPYYNLYYGASLYQLKEYEISSKLIQSCKDIVIRDGYIFNGTGCSWLRGVNSYIYNLDYSPPLSLPPPKILFDTPIPDLFGKSIYFLASADSDYFSKFGGGLIKSFTENRDDTSILTISIINPSIEAKNWVSKNRKDLIKSGVHFLYTSGPKNKAYYASSRFLLMPQLLKTLKTGILSLDIDALFVSRTSTLSLALKTLDAALEQQEHRLPWQRCQAGRVYFGYTDAGKHMSDVISNFCRRVYNETIDQWFLDQNALEYYRRTQEPPLTAKIVNFYKIPSVRNAIFSPPGSKKKQLENSLY